MKFCKEDLLENLFTFIKRIFDIYCQGKDLADFHNLQCKLEPVTLNLRSPKNSLKYNIAFLSIEKTGRKPCSIREHIISIVMVSERDFDNVTCVWSCNVYAV